jgi:hypothetical protein
MKVFLMHRKGFKERFNKVTDLIMQCDFVEDIEIVTSEQSDICFSTMEEKKLALPSDFPVVEINSGNRSLIHKQFRAFKKIADEGKPAMILEDDVIFDPSALNNFVNNFNSIPEDWEFCFFGTGCWLKIEGQGFVKNNNRLKSKCTDSMIVHPSAAQKIYEDMKSTRVYLPIDWDLSYRFLKLNTTVYWYEPGLIVQGSQNGTYQSEIQGKP